jgi:hypothetical protein
MYKLIVLLCLLLGWFSLQASARTTVLQWDYTPEPGVNLILQACVLDKDGTCVMADIQAVPGYRLRTEVYIPDGTTRCFTIKAVTEGRDSLPSNRVCLK